MKATTHSFEVNGEIIRVVVAGDVVALPDEGWSGGNYGSMISVAWLLYDNPNKLPGNKARRQKLARCIQMALEAHHARLGQLEENHA